MFDEERPNSLSDLCCQFNIPFYTTAEMYGALGNGALPFFEIGISYLYPRLLRKSIIEYPSQGIINFHPAPVSVHKGLAACCYCLLHDYAEWAVTAHYASAKFDEGDVIEEHWFPMTPSSRQSAFKAEQYIQKKSLLLFADIIRRILSGEILPRHVQDLGKGTYFSREDLEQIKDVTNIYETEEIDKRIRALWFPPYKGAFITIGGKQYSLISSELLTEIAGLYINAMKGK